MRYTIRGCSLAIILLAAAPVVAQPLSLVTAPKYAAILEDAATGEILYARQPDAPRFPASITKVMTLYLAFERLASGQMHLTDRLVMSAHAAAQAPSKLGLKPGQSLSLDDAIRTIACKSANDVAMALAEHIGGSEAGFAAMMTRKAHALGMSGTQFVNPTGLPDARQITTARDIATLSRSVLRDFPQYYSYFGQQAFVYGAQVMANHNHLLGVVPGVDGIKTGYTAAAGFTLAASAMRDGRRLIAVVLGAPARLQRDDNVSALLNAGFEVFGARARGQRASVSDFMSEPQDINDGLLQTLADPGPQVTQAAGPLFPEH